MDFSIDFVAIFKIIMIDIMLGGDNAILIGMACAALPVTLRTKAILLGTLGAIVIRGIALAGADWLMGVTLLKLIAGAYLIYIGYGLINGNDSHSDIPANEKMWAAIKTIIVADLIMSIDNVFAVVAAAQSAGEHSTLYAIAGIVLSIPIIIAGSTLIVGMMTRFPIIIWAGGGLLGLVGAEMMITDPLVVEYFPHDTHLFVKAAGFLSVILAAAVVPNLFPKKELKNV